MPSHKGEALPALDKQFDRCAYDAWNLDQHQLHAARRHVSLGNRPEWNGLKVWLPREACQYEADQRRQYIVRQAKRFESSAKAGGCTLLAVTLIPHQGHVDPNQLTPAVYAVVRRRLQRELRLLPQPHWAIGTLDTSYNLDAAAKPNPAFQDHAHLLVAVQAGPPRRARAKVLEALAPSPRSAAERTLHGIREEVDVQPYRPGTWTENLARVMMLAGNCQNSFFTRPNGQHGFSPTHSPMPDRPQAILLNCLLKMQWQERLLLANVRRGRNGLVWRMPPPGPGIFD